MERLVLSLIYLFFVLVSVMSAAVIEANLNLNPEAAADVDMVINADGFGRPEFNGMYYRPIEGDERHDLAIKLASRGIEIYQNHNGNQN